VRRVVDCEIALCEIANRKCRSAQLKNFFVVVRWLGDGKAWYFLMIALPLPNESDCLSRGTQEFFAPRMKSAT